jgi:C-terminal processing protease CtpA/Prc
MSNTQNLSHTEQDQIVLAAAQAIHDQYVFPDQAAALEQHLRKWWQSKPEIPANLLGFCVALTTQIRQHTNDLHLGIVPIPQHQAPQYSSDTENIQKVEILDGNIGLIAIQSFEAVQQAVPMIAAAMQLVAQTRALIVDIRQHKGGDAQTATLMEGFFFEQPIHTSTFWNRSDTQGIQTWTPSYLPAPRYLEREVVILTSRRTASAAEDLAYVLKHLNRAYLIGERTYGAAHPGGMMQLHPMVQIFIPTGRPVVQATGGNWEGIGVEPDLDAPAEEALDRALEYLRDKIRHSSIPVFP